ncbi:hypothetical protein NDA11_003090 [Ustilago hordei]|nr:hypothetical protein NDA10_006939 [Ustilago hordei]KAJ1576635.1 hypothetical protein NDA11_003090 [Ustilago hordei]KAJ1596238.1 hypothetical protein NDA14_001788 [Ustilago hordei]UTT88844.1 hypothetical protein NDA17_006684 [Ustilago hordei]
MATTSLLRRCAPYLLSSLLLVLQILATAATMTPSGIPEKLFPASLDPFVNELSLRGFLYTSRIELAFDLTNMQFRSHHALTDHFFKNGQDWNPRVVYLGEHPALPSTHMAASVFHPNIQLTNHLVPKSGLMKHRNGKNGVLAINLRANEEPEFVGVLWLKSHRAVNVLERSGMRLNEVEEQVPSLIDIQRVIHRQPVPGPYRTVRTVGSSDRLD